MPMDRSLYPSDWDDIAKRIKDSVDWRCEECSRPCRRPGETLESLDDRLTQIGPWKGAWLDDLYEEYWDDETGEHGMIPKLGRFTLTVAHLNHQPSDCRRDNLRALCAPCHCRYDLKAMATKRRLKRERDGQLTLDSLLPPMPAGKGRDISRVQLPIGGMLSPEP